ncbi:MAG: VCBS repeat-containing protein [Kiritimatiellia bacterium]
MNNTLKFPLLLFLAALRAEAAPAFTKQVVTDKFWSEGVAVGDFNRDGAEDLCAGPFWYEGPGFTKRNAYRPATAAFQLKGADGTQTAVEGFSGALGNTNAYSDDFMNFTRDFNGDGWTDILVVGLPGTAATWYENPKGKPGEWTPHRIFDVVDNESPMLADVDGDKAPDLVCGTGGFLGYATMDPADAAKPWTYHRISPKGPWHKYTHGLGVGDLNGDGRADMLLPDGWWEQPAALAGDPVWKSHPFKFAEGGAQMFIYDVNGDGRNDVITCEHPHRHGLVWWEQEKDGAGDRFIRHVIMGSKPEENAQGVVFTQPHAMEMCDVDGDGLMDLVTGKRFWAHGPEGDVDPNAPAVLYWFRLSRDPATGEAGYTARLIDDNSGVGMQVGRFSDGSLAISNKRGLFVFKKSIKD